MWLLANDKWHPSTLAELHIHLVAALLSRGQLIFLRNLKDWYIVFDIRDQRQLKEAQEMRVPLLLLYASYYFLYFWLLSLLSTYLWTQASRDSPAIGLKHLLAHMWVFGWVEFILSQ